MGVNIPQICPDEYQTDLNLIRGDDSKIDKEVRQLQTMAQLQGRSY